MDTLKDLGKYSGLNAKVRILYGKRLRREEYKALMSMGSIPEIAAYLKRHGSWANTFSDLEEVSARRGYIESRLQRSYFDEYLRIMNFVLPDDKDLMRFPYRKAEIDFIMLFLRNLMPDNDKSIYGDLYYLKKGSKIDFQSLSNAGSYVEVLKILRKTKYYGPLSRLAPKPGEPIDISTIEIVLRGGYYSSLFSILKKRYSGDIKELIYKYLGTQIDLINITRVIRLKNTFSIEPELISNYLLPFEHRADRNFLKNLYMASDLKAAMSMLEKSRYKDIFTDKNFEYIEDYYFKFIYNFNKKMLVHGFPSIFKAIAYLALKDLEMLNLIHIIECVRYNVPANEIPVYLIGYGD